MNNLGKSISKFFLTIVLVSNNFVVSAQPIQAVAPLYISRVSVEIKGDTLEKATAVVTWLTNREADARVDYGLTSDYGAYVASSLTPQLYHEVIIANLKSQTTYHFKVSSTATDGAYTESFDQNFKTPKLKDTTKPQLDLVGVSFEGATYAVITWETDENADSVVKYGNDSELKKYHTSSGASNTTQHEVILKNLQKNTTYFYQVSSKDTDKNQVWGGIRSFTTAMDDTVDKADLVIDRIAPVAFPDPLVSQHSVTVNWHTNHPSKGSVQLSAKKQKTQRVTEQGFAQVDHQLTVYNLAADTTYIMQIQAGDIFGKSLTVKNLTIRTLPDSGWFSATFDKDKCGSDNIYGGYCRSLGAEQTEAKHLKGYLDDVFKNNVPAAALNNWFTLVKAYVYGGYPLSAITQAIKFGGKTVHPTIPWSVWKNTADYKDYINK